MVYALDINQNTFAPAKFSNLGAILSVFLPLLTIGAAVVFLVMLLSAGFRLLTGAGNPEMIKKAQQTIGFAILGLFIVISAFLAVKLIGVVFNINNILP